MFGLGPFPLSHHIPIKAYETLQISDAFPLCQHHEFRNDTLDILHAGNYPKWNLHNIYYLFRFPISISQSSYPTRWQETFALPPMFVGSNLTPNIYRIISTVTSKFTYIKLRNLLWFSPSGKLTGRNFRLPNWRSFGVLLLVKSCITTYIIIVSICRSRIILTLILLTWRIWWAPNNASKWQMGFNSAFNGLNLQRRWIFKSKYCPRWRDFKFVIPLNSFTTVQCTVTGAERLNSICVY
jgi:hypothetical protein